MIPDPILIAAPVLNGTVPMEAGSHLPLWIQDVGPQTSKRSASGTVMGLSGKFTLSISHSVSKENAPVQTDRTLVRLDYLPGTPDAQGLTPVSSVYFVLAQARGNVTTAEMVALFQSLLGTLIYPDPTATDTANDGILTRILNGEP